MGTVNIKNRKAKNSSLLRTYGITLEQYEEAFRRQKGECAVCHRHQDNFKTLLCVDHDHHSNEIRGLLCTYCNRRVVGRYREESLVLLRSLVKYLEGPYTGWFAPKKKPRKRKKKI